MLRAVGKLMGLCAAFGVVVALAEPARGQKGMACQKCCPKGMMGTMKGDPAWMADHQTFFILLDYRKYIRRQVTNLSSGVETLTESSNKALAAKIQEHAEAMKKRLDEGRPIHIRDPLFAEIFRNASKIKMTIERTKQGVRVTETSDDPDVAKLIQAHARVVSQFLKNGRYEMMKNHALPKREKAP